MQGTTFATIGEGRVVIGGQENPLAQGTINRDINGGQIVTVNEGTKFSFDIPLVDFNQLSQNATSAFNLMQALTTPVPDDVAAMGSEGSDLYRRMIASGMSVAQAQEMAQSEDFANAVAMRQNVDSMLARNGGSAQGLSRDQLLLTMLGESVLTSGDNPLVSVDCNLAGTQCQVQLNALLASAGVSSIQDLVAQRLSSGDAKQVAAAQSSTLQPKEASCARALTWGEISDPIAATEKRNGRSIGVPELLQKGAGVVLTLIYCLLHIAC